MSNLVIVQDFKPEYSENILPNTALISDSSDISFSGDGTVVVSNDFQFSDNKSLLLEMPLNVSSSKSTIFNLGTDLEKQVKYNGNYLFSFRVLQNSLGISNSILNIKVNVFINSILTHTFEVENIQHYYDYFKFYTFAQSFNLSANDIVNFTFELSGEPISPTPTLKFHFSGFKLELDDRFLGIPSIYSKPKDYDISDTKGYMNNTHHGWGYYADSLATPSITVGTSYTQITIDGLGALTNENYLPLEIRGTSSLWSGNKITPISVGDDWDGRFDITVSSKSGSPSFIEVILDISGSTAGTNKVFTGYIQTSPTVPYDQSLLLDFFSLSTFLANGGRIYAKVDSGSVTITRRNIKISRKSKAF